MKKTIIIITCIIVFSTWIFYPIFNYSENFDKLPWRIVIYDRNQELITDKAKKNGYYKSIDTNIQNKFIKSLLEIEDKTFFSNYWVSILSKLRAIKDNILKWRIVSWWSTITEQYIKNKYFLWKERTIFQKIREAFLAIYVSFSEDKKDILKWYLNNVYFWNNIYGIWWAIEVYFWKNDLKELTEEEISLLISLVRYPSIQSLNENSFLKHFERIKQKLWFKFEKSIKKLTRKQNIDKNPFVTNILTKNNKNKEIIIDSTIDSELSNFSKEVLNKTLDELKDKNVTNWAIFALNPKTMEVLIYEWSRDFNSQNTDWEVDVINSRRQMWSTIKPFLYLQALEKWANPDDLLIDIESEYNSFKDSSVYISENYSLKEYGLIRLKRALWNSLNNATVRLAREIWLQEVYSFYKKYWFNFEYEPEHYWYSLVLWNPDMSLESLVVNYINLIPDYEINNLRKPTFIKHENNYWDKEIDKNKFLLYDILKDPDNRDISFWVNSILNTSIAQAVKTWTSSDFRDNIIISYDKDLVLWIWIGNNDNSSMIWVTWITGAWYIWHHIIEEAIKKWYINNKEYVLPDWIEESEYCLDNNCFRKEIIKKKVWKQYFSTLANWFYDNKDLFENPTDFEKEKLNDMKFDLR